MLQDLTVTEKASNARYDFAIVKDKEPIKIQTEIIYRWLIKSLDIG